MSLFPMFLKLDGKPCLVVGAGTIAAPKIASLLRASAQVTVIAPQALPQVEAWAREGRVHWLSREFAEDDVRGVFLVVAATNMREVNHAVAEAARAQGILINSVDDPPDCDFYYPSVVERGDLQIAVSTGGKSPALAQRLREELDALVAEDAGEWLDSLGERRLQILAALPASEERKQILHELARRESCDPLDCPVDRTLQRLLAEQTGTLAQAGTVYLTGAGPGAGDLLTLRAKSLIESASCILHDDLVSADVLRLVRADAKVVNVGKRCGQKIVTQEQIHAWMIEFARKGMSVVRLKSGDPTLFGRAAEEIAALTAAEVPFEIVPGISASFAAAAAAAVSLTDRDASSRIIFTTRHRAGNVTGGICSEDVGSTLALYMPGKDYAALQGELMDKGWPATTKCVMVSAVSLHAEQVRVVPLGDLARTPALPAPVVILIIPEVGR
jgi:uroporphyrin-III C-methyltransferase / precorrin-2 dehydrogenase / sirohydrochlorin ferrochelatase